MILVVRGFAACAKSAQAVAGLYAYRVKATVANLKVFFTGKNAGCVFSEGCTYNPFQAEEHTYCQDANPTCIVVQDDFLQVVDAARAPIASVDPSFESGLDGWTLPGPPLPGGSAGQSDETGWVRARGAATRSCRPC